MNESQEASSSHICKVCKKESGLDMEDLQLHFVDTSAVYNSHTGGSIIAQD